jgi:hypothetical protein
VAAGTAALDTMARLMPASRMDDWESTHQRRRPLLPALALLMLVGVAVAGVLVTRGGSSSSELAVEEATEPVAEPTFGVASSVPAAPLTPRGGVVHAWTGEELVVWGGITVQGPPTDDELPERIEGLHRDGAALDRATDRWRTLADSPLSPRVEPAFAWAEDRLFVWGGADADNHPLADGAAYVPADDRWEPLPPAPFDGRVGAAAVWTGEELLILGGFVPGGLPGVGDPPERARDAGAFDPDEGTWRMLTPPPEEFEFTTFPDHLWTGERLIMWQGTRGAAYDPERDTWQLLDPDARLRAPGPTVVAAIGPGRVAVVGARPADAPRAPGIVYDLDDGLVEAISAMGPRWPGVPPRLITAGEHVVALPAVTPEEQQRAPAPVVWDVRAGVWRELPPELGSRSAYALAWTGEEVLVWGGSDGEGSRSDGIRWQPTSP